MGSRKSRAFEAYPRKQRVSFDYLLHRLGADSPFNGQLGLHAFLHQRVEAELCQSHGRRR